MPIEFAKISSLQFSTLPKKKTVFFFSVGPLEDHGPHLPIGLDLEEANRLCYLAACHLENDMPGWVAVLMPPAPLGIDSNTTHLSITVRPHVLRDWLVDACHSLIRNGFFHFTCFSGHLGPRQLTAIEDAGTIIRKSGKWHRWSYRIMGGEKITPSLISASSGSVDFQRVLDSPFWPDPLEHGGKRDTSIALAIANHLVHPHYKTMPTIHREPSRWKRNINRRRGRLSNYWGTPADADVAYGEEEIIDFLNKLLPKMRAVWEGANPNLLFKTWYSVLPSNKSFFKAWLLVFLICIFIGAWSFINAIFFQSI